MTIPAVPGAGPGGPIPWIDAWTGSQAIARLVREFGGEDPRERELAGRLEYLDDFSLRWDFRAGVERNLVETPDMEPRVASLVLGAADALGLRGTTDPGRRRYAQVVILGGLARACLARPRHAASLLADGGATAERVIALGGFRKLKGDEIALVADFLSEPAEDEYEVMDAGVRAAFGLGAPLGARGEASDVVGESWSVRDYRTSGGLSVHVVAAPSSQPGRRATTPDTYAWLASASGWLRPGDDLLLVTTDIYRPYQHAEAIRMLALPHGVRVDLVGMQPGAVDPRLAQPFLPHNYLQEIRSTIRSMRALHAVAA